MTASTNSDIRVLKQDEVDAVAGGFFGIVIAAELFAIGFAAGVVACNVKNDRPPFEF